MDYFNSPNLYNQDVQPTPPAPPPPHPASHAPHPISSTSPSGRIATQQPQPQSRIRRRNRMITSCLECRRRKLKCDKSHPCTNCIKFTRDCVFLAPALDQASQLKLTEIKDKVGSLERLLERDVAKPTREGLAGDGGGEGSGSRVMGNALPGDEDDGLEGHEDEKDLEPTPLAVVDAAYGEDGEDDDLLDLGVKLGKMRITERIGGFFRPKISEELSTMTDPLNTGHKPTPDGVANAPSPSSSFIKPIPPAAEWLKPGPSYIMPSSGFFFGSQGQQASLIDFLPSRLAADRLVKQYFACVHPVAQCVHRPSFEKEYDTFWDEVSLGVEPPNSVQAVVFAALLSGAVSLDEAVVLRDFGVSQESLISNFKLGTETALARANFLRTTKMETLQGFVMYMIPLCRSEVSRAHSVLLGAAIRMAECMGLHRDGEMYGMNALETHVRRLIWHQLCFLDIRTCEAQGPRPSIRKEEFDTKLPLNINDVDLHATGRPPIPSDKFTDTTFSLIRFEAIEMMRTLWIDRPRLERRKISLTAVLSKIETFKSNMNAKYDHLMDDRIPVQKAAKIVKALLTSRLHVMVLHRYHTSVVTPMPDRLRNIMLSNGTAILEAAVALETLPVLKNWAWYVGALTQHHTAFLLLMDVYMYPNRKENDRIWLCLDYIFECDPAEDRQTKALKVLSELQQKTAIYQSMRGMRAPTVMEKRIGQRPPRVANEPTITENKNLIYMKSPSPAEAQPPPPNTQQLRSPLAVPYESIYKQPVTGLDGGMNMSAPLTTAGNANVIPEVVFAGVSNGEALWALPNQLSPGDSSEASGKAGDGGGGGEGVSSDDLMRDIDWDAFDALFPKDQQQDWDMPLWTGYQFPPPAEGGVPNFMGRGGYGT